METITPSRAKAWRKAIGEAYAELRADIAEIRRLRAIGRKCVTLPGMREPVLADEWAESMVEMIPHKRADIRRARARLAAAAVEKYSNLSPAAAARLAARNK